MPDQFWSMTILEITDLMESYHRRKLAEIKQDLKNKHFLARDIGQFIDLALNGSQNTDFHELWDFFPELFKEEKEMEEQRRTKQQLALYKAKMLDYAYRHNHKNGGEDPSKG